MSNRTLAAMPPRKLRIQAAANTLKSLFLGSKHRGGEPQWAIFVEAMSPYCASGDNEIDVKTWTDWINGQVKPKLIKLEFLDEVLWNLIKSEIEAEKAERSKEPRLRFISRLVRGEGMEGMKLKYPLGQLLLHLDAIDAGAWWAGKNESQWQIEKLRRVNSVLEQLHAAWNPDQGWIYQSFRSDFRIAYETAPPETQLEMRANTARFKPDIFEHLMKREPRPSSDLQGDYSSMSPAVGVIDFLLSIATDKDFLVHERAATWAIDLASAGAALIGLAHAHRREVFASKIPRRETLLVLGFQELFWSPGPNLAQILSQFGVGDEQLGPEGVRQFSRLLLARRAYRHFLRTYGISWRDIDDTFNLQWEKWPIRLQG